ncbi:TPA: hypothetical protein IUT15_001018 [Enterococcus faecalis]|nr:hypothetical protein [Enterococcus faecalis]
MQDGSSGEFWYAYHVYHANGMLPSTFSLLPKKEKAMLMAFIDMKAEAEEKEAKKIKTKTRRR